MTKLFLRDWSVKAVKNSVITEVKDFKGISVSFDIEKSIDRGINKGSITLYNLQESYRRFLAQKNISIELQAGYIDGGLVSIFSGDVELCDPELRGTNWETKLEVRDGAKITRATEAKKSFKKGASIKGLFDYLIGLLVASSDPNIVPLTKGSIDLSMIKGSLSKGKSISGNAYEELFKLCRDYSLELFVTDGVLNIAGYRSNILTETVSISRSSGLIGTPEITDDGVKCYVLLQKGIYPGQIFSLDSSEAKGEYYVKNAKYKGDSKSNPWGIEIEALTA